MRRLLPLAVSILLAVALAGADDWRTTTREYAWSFPRDHGAHPDFRIEWWYLTGHLDSVDRPGRSFGWQLTIFRVGLLPHAPELESAWRASALFMGHMAVTDKDGERHVFSDVLWRASPLLATFHTEPEPLIARGLAPPGTDGHWTIAWNGSAFDVAAMDARRGIAFELTTSPEKPLVFQGPNGFSAKSREPGAASHYYSFTRLATRGTLSIGGERHRVRGRSWMDHEFSSSQLTGDQVGWDWFSLQLADGREVMLYVLRDRAGRVDFGRGTLVSPGGEPGWLAPEAWRVRATGSWTSDESGITYPSGWELEIPAAGLALRVVPDPEDQEIVTENPRGIAYWEGAVRVLDARGRPAGRGYVELTGYGEGNRPPV